MGVKDMAVKAKKAINKMFKGSTWRYFDMSTPESRQATVEEDYNFALTQRSERETKWIELDNYYNNKHITATEIYNQLKEQGIPWTPAVVPDSYIHVESQIIPDIPDFEFRGRDDDMDSQKAKQREYVVKYIIENNKINNMNTENERRLGILGDAFWKVSWDGDVDGYGYKGDIIIGNPGAENILPDPAAFTLDDCETFIYAYRMHRRKAARKFAKDLDRLGITIDDLGTDGKATDTEIFTNQTRDVNDDTLQIVEYWFRQNEYGKGSYESDVDGMTGKVAYDWEPGDIGCSIQISGKEIRYIPKYWVKTGKQNKNFPFVQYCKIPTYNSFWNKSDLEAIKDLQDQCDRELATAILNNTFTANDIVVVEENAIADGGELENKPGAMWKVKSGMINSVRRLQGLGNANNRMEMINFLRGMIQETVGNFDSAQGKEPIRVTTASGIAQLNERANMRKDIKKADRLTGFEKLYELLDWTALEFYDDNRLIYIGAKKDGEEPVSFNFNSDNISTTDMTGNTYYPRLDAVINAGDGSRKSKAFTLAATENLITKPINETNYKIVTSMLDILDLPDSKDIKEYYESLYAPKVALIQAQTEQQIQQIMNPPIPQQQPMQGQAPQQPQEENYDDIIAGLTPEEQQIISDNPDILINALEGGGING